MLHIKKIKIKEDNDMKIINKDIDSGKLFDWGQTSLDYAKFRDIYPQEFYQRIVDRKLCLDGQSVLDFEQERGFFLEICINMGRSGRLRIFQKTKLNKQKFSQRVWI